MNKYEVLGIVGEGAYGVVLRCRNRETDDIVAIKKFKEGEDDDIVKKTTLREVKLLRMLRSQPNIVHLHDAFRRRGKLYLVFEYVERNLLEVLEEHPDGLGAEMVRRLVFQLCVAIEWCHRNRVIHRDIKPENLLVNPADKSLKLCDFGFARTVSSKPTDLTDYVATRWYRAPELLLGSTRYDFSVDIWAIGCIMGELADGQPLFPGQNEVDQLYVIQKAMGALIPAHKQLFLRNPRFQGLTFPTMTSRGIDHLMARYARLLPREAIDFQQACLKMDPSRRLSAVDCVSHPWFAGLPEEHGLALRQRRRGRPRRWEQSVSQQSQGADFAAAVTL